MVTKIITEVSQILYINICQIFIRISLLKLFQLRYQLFGSGRIKQFWFKFPIFIVGSI